LLPENWHESIMLDGREELSDIKSDDASLETSTPVAARFMYQFWTAVHQT